MMISGYNSLTPTDSVTQSDATPTSRSSRGGSSAVTDQTNLSADQQTTQQWRDSLNSLPETRADRVAAAQNAVQNGTLPSNGQIANAMYQELRG
jgi:flagellar biosynthesis anti-sigma factor FlgM